MSSPCSYAHITSRPHNVRCTVIYTSSIFVLGATSKKLAFFSTEENLFLKQFCVSGVKVTIFQRQFVSKPTITLHTDAVLLQWGKKAIYFAVVRSSTACDVPHNLG